MAITSRRCGSVDLDIVLDRLEQWHRTEHLQLDHPVSRPAGAQIREDHHAPGLAADWSGRTWRTPLERKAVA